ncbi:MAG: hypothetical protein EWM73_00302 [Nitrospira sp.]|nr:MAG: hypothetical protein EWM73_00302 [Nitrospira sp.]
MPLRGVEIGEQMARYVQDSNKPLAVGQVESDYPSQAVTHDLASRISRPCSGGSVQTVSIGRTGQPEREPVSSGAIPWRYFIGQPHPVVETQAVPGGRFGNAPGVSRCQHAGEFLWALLSLALVAPGAGFAQEERTSTDELTSPAPPQAAPIGPPAPEGPKQRLNWETGAGRSYIIPAFEVTGYLLLLNQFDRHFVEPKDVYRTGTGSFWKNLTDSKWVIDEDPFGTNQFLHPYGGSIYYGLARSTGLSFWESFGYATAGSVLWELGGETGPPSINDQITTPIAGSFLGEPLFRMASLLLENDGGPPGFWRELGAAALSPPTGFNRLVFGNRFDAVFPSHAPVISTRFQLGTSLNTVLRGQGVVSRFRENEATVDFQLAYGLPGKPGYSYTRPFDYFNFQFTASTASTFENIIIRGLLVGAPYSAGDSYRGVWGLFGSYDYIAPQVFRVSSTALNLGTTAQWWLSQAVALQGTALGGVGYGAAGTIHGSGERDYHYGATPQALLELRLILADRAMVNVTAQEYYVSGVGSTESRGSETIARGTASFTLRVYDHHAIALKYVASQRDAQYPDLPDRHQTVGTVTLAYTFIGSTGFGAVEWRE